MPIYPLSILILTLTLVGCNDQSAEKQSPPPTVPREATPPPLKQEERADLEKYFREENVIGAFVLFDEKQNTHIRVNPERCGERFIPASTFKIPNSLIGLETGVITDEKMMLPWDSVKRREPWDKDQDMSMAMRNSTVWFYQELARRVGEKRMKEYVDTLRYGNMDISGGVDKFWLTGGLRISPDEQIDFLRRFYHEKLPISKRSIDIVKRITLLDETAAYELHGKTGWGIIGKKNIGWLVGYVEKQGNVYYFATNIESDEAGDDFPSKRMAITKQILKELGVI